MKLFKGLACVVSAGALLLSLGQCAHADVTYTSQTLMGDRVLMTQTTEVKGHKQRVETKMDFGPMHRDTVDITDCDAHQKITADPNIKMFMVGPIVPNLAPASPMMQRGAPHKTGTGHVAITVAMEDKGTEKIGQFDTHHWLVHMQTVSSGCAGDRNTNMDMDLWVAPVVKVGFSCEEHTRPLNVVDNEGCKITYELKGDFKKFAEIQKDLVVQRTFSNGRFNMTMKVTQYSLAAVSDADFAPPAGFTRASRVEYEQAEAGAMRQMMPMPGGPRP